MTSDNSTYNADVIDKYVWKTQAPTGIEPVTVRLRSARSTNWAKEPVCLLSLSHWILSYGLYSIGVAMAKSFYSSWWSLFATMMIQWGARTEVQSCLVYQELIMLGAVSFQTLLIFSIRNLRHCSLNLFSLVVLMERVFFQKAWRNGSASDSSPEGCGFNSHCFQTVVV